MLKVASVGMWLKKVSKMTQKQAASSKIVKEN